MIKTVAFIFLFLMQYTVVFCQDAYTLVEQKLPEAFDLLIKTKAIHRVFQDSRGFFWVMSNHGLARFDGYELKYFRHNPDNNNSISDDIALVACEDKDGNIWFGMISTGLCCYNYMSNSFTNYQGKNLLQGTLGSVNCLFVDSQNEVWFSMGRTGISHLNKTDSTFDTFDVITAERCPYNTPYRIEFNNFVMDIKERDSENLWLGTPDGLFNLHKKTKSFTVLRPKKQFNLDADIYNAKSIIVAGSKVWIGGFRSGLQCYDTLTKQWSDYDIITTDLLKQPRQHMQNVVLHITPKDSDTFWIASYDQGLCIFNTTTKKCRFFSEESKYNFLPKTEALFLITDNKSNLFVLYNNQYFYLKICPNLFKQFSIPRYQHLNDGYPVIESIYEDTLRNTLYATTLYSDNLISINKATGISQRVKPILNGKIFELPSINQIIPIDAQSVYLLTSKQYFIYNLVNNHITIPLQPDTIKDTTNDKYSLTSLTVDQNKNLWFGTTHKGIIKLNTTTGTTTFFATTENDTAEFGTKFIHLVYADVKNRIWYATGRASITAYYNQNIKKSVYINDHGLPDVKSNSISSYNFISKGNFLFVSSIKGLMVFDISTETPTLIKHIRGVNGLGNTLVTNLVFENDSLIWLDTYFGVVRYNLNNNKHQIINNDNGIDGKYQHVLSGAQKNIYVAASPYIYEYMPELKAKDYLPVTPALTSFKVNDDQLNFEYALQNGQIIIKPEYSYFTVAFASLDFANAAQYRYSYQLENFNEKWVDAGNIRYATFSNLKGGNYILKIRSTLDNGITYSTIKSIPIFIETVYYKTLWFKTVVVGAIATLLIAIYRYRMQQQRAIELLNTLTQRLEKEKSIVHYENLKQQLNPHFLFNSLTSLSSLIATEPKIARQFVDQMSKVYRYILKSSDHETVLLADELKFANTYIQLQKTRFENGFEVHITIDDRYLNRSIVPVTLQNLVENALKHNIVDDESPLKIEVFVQQEYLVVKNNLQLKTVVETSNKQGLDKMKSLYKYLSCNPIVVENNDGFFQIKIPLI
ncbi:MAG TPA: histidine kinase [Bacteroidia bacterium]|nr:histidine kinase [Bacteroidia bacterium]